MSGAGAAIDKAALPGEVQPFVPVDEEATDLDCADLNGDGRDDYLLITRDKKLSRRTTHILLRTADGKLSTALSNPNVIQTPAYDGINGSYTTIARRDRIEVINISAGSWGW